MRSCIIALAVFALAAGRAQTIDDFSTGGWVPFATTPGKMTAEAGGLRLVDSPEDPAWYTVSKTFSIDFDQTPFLLIEVAELTDRGTVKLIKKDPDDKQTVMDIDREGLYAVDMRKYKWSGTGRVEVCLYAIGNEAEITYRYARFAAAVTPEEQARITERQNAPNAKLTVAPFELVPLFNACSYYFLSPERTGLAVQYRRQGGPWRPAFPPVYIPSDGMYRGSVVRLEEDTAYDLRIVDAQGAVLQQGEFRTWSSNPPVAKTVVLDETNFSGRLRIRDQGRPDGWIKYTAKDGFVLRNERTGPLLELVRAQYVILDGLTLRGGRQDSVIVDRCQNVRIQNCDIAGWGRDGKQRFDLNGMYYTEAGEAINWDTAIRISRSAGTVVERCYIHDPVSTANSWYYAHPAGPQALGIDKPVSTVVRYNDFIGSDEHRWNDAIEGAGNFQSDGGFNRDADIYGEFHCFANDDAIEIDGGQINVRVFDNKFEGCLCGVSIQGCMSGPSYVFDNLLVNMGDERGLAGQTIKTSSNESGPSAVSFILGNTTFGDSGDLNFLNHLKVVAHNNVLAGRSNITGRSRSPQSVADYNLQARGTAGEEPHGLVGDPAMVDPQTGRFELRADSPAIGKGTPLPNFTSEGPVDLGAVPLGSNRDLPIRPLPVAVDTPQLSFSAAELKATPTRTVTVTVGGNGFAGSYRIAQNEAFDWFTVTPDGGTLRSGQTQRFTVTLLPEKMKARPRYRGAFLIRMADGLSRPVTVYAQTDYVQAVKPGGDGVWSQYIEAEAPSAGKAYEVVDDPAASGGKAIKLAGPEGKEPAEYRFSVPRDGVYFAILRLRADEPTSSHDSVQFAVDDLALDRAQLRARTTWSWCMAAQNRAMSLICHQPLKLKAGQHTVKLAPREELYLDLLALTDNPKVFE